MRIDLKKEPFSYRGAYLTISHIGKYGEMLEKLYIRSVHTRENSMEVFRLELLDAESHIIEYEEEGFSDHVRLKSKDACVLFCFENPRRMRVKGRGCGLRLSMNSSGYDSAIRMAEDVWQINSATCHTNFMLRPFQGVLHMDAPWNSVGCGHIIAEFLPAADGEWEGVLEEKVINPQIPKLPELTFEQCRQKAEQEFDGWMQKMPRTPEKFAQGRMLAGYVMWSGYVYPIGNYKREAMVMSKNWMNCVWSWDHCFNAMALSFGHEKEAWEQFRIVFDNQDASGVLPDYVNEADILWNFTKTPVHGWALGWMLDRGCFSEAELEEIYEPLCRWTNWWFRYRDYDKDGMPQCNHGNDSVSDNCTAFDVGCPLESPVLSAFLVLQMETLERIAAVLGKEEESRQWGRRSKEHLQLFMEHFWTGNGIVARISGSHKLVQADSNYMYIPAVLGKRLTEPVRQWLTAGMRKEGYLLTPYGLATESPASPFYEADSYCRGPIWAPTTLIMVDGLWQMGEKELASDIAGRFCKMVQAGHMAECFDALSGEPQRDPAYTWTASVFLILASCYLNEPEKNGIDKPGEG